MALCACLGAATASCVGAGMLTDGSTISVGTTSIGALRDGTTLPFHGEGYYVPRRWRERRRNYGTDELVQLLVRASRRVKRRHRKATLGVADLSPRGGGPTPEHKSHRSGRDVDLLFYQLDHDTGKPVRPEAMLPFDKDGEPISAEEPASAPAGGDASAAAGAARVEPSTDGTAPAPAEEEQAEERRRFDVERNWTLVRALVTDPLVSVQWIFIDRDLRALLLRHARRRKVPEHIIARAATVLRHARAHADHLHVRVFCSPSDRVHGCIDIGPARWHKKDIKYLHSPAPGPGLPAGLNLASIFLRPARLVATR